MEIFPVRRQLFEIVEVEVGLTALAIASGADDLR